MKTLEQQFTEAIFIHKSSIVLGALLKYYRDIQDTGVTIPEFLDKTVEEKAQEHYFKLLANNTEFEEMYDKCWEQFGAILP